MIVGAEVGKWRVELAVALEFADNCDIHICTDSFCDPILTPRVRAKVLEKKQHREHKHRKLG